MNYKKIYDDLMGDRFSKKSKRIIEKKQGSYFERHHITPLSLGGNKSYALGSDNIVLLTAREHYLAQRLIWLIYRTREMGFAFHKMVFSISPLQERRFDARAYESAKIALSQCQRGENNPMYGKTSWMKGKEPATKGKKLAPRPHLAGENNPSYNDDIRLKISEKLKGRERPHCRGIKSSNFGGSKVLVENGCIVMQTDRLEDFLDIIDTSIHNLRNHLRSRKGGLIKNRYQVFYFDEYKKKLES